MNLAPIRRLRDEYEHWAATCYRIKDKHGRIVPLRLRPMQRAIGLEEQRQLRETGKARIWVLKGRQGGITTDQQARSLHTIWGTPGAECITLAHERDATDKIFGITERAINEWPHELLALQPALGDAMAKEISFPGLDSVLYTGTAGAKRTGRGLTLYRLHGSEFAFWDDPMTVLGAISPALERPGTTIVLESTASGYDSEPHVFYREAKARGWRPLFFPWWDCDPALYRDSLDADGAADVLATLTEEERALVTGHGLDAEQIAWRRRKMLEMGRETFLQEYAEDEESCWLAPGGMVYDAAVLKLLMSRAPVPVRVDGDVQWFVTEAELARILESERIILGADTAEGVAGDRSTIVARAFPSWRRVLVYESNRVDPLEFARVLNHTGQRLGLAYLVVEKNAHGITALRQLRDVYQYPGRHIYHRAIQDKENKRRTERIGWHTSGETQPILIDAARELFAACARGDAPLEVPVRGVIRDAFGVRRDDTGRVILTGKDLLVAEALAWIGRASIPPKIDTTPLHFHT